jgi:Zn finger protein HypA/HybF involved in hydrogenase expression
MKKELTRQEKEFEETSTPLVAAKCAICGEEYIATDFLAICPKCRNAILYARALMKEDENGRNS